MKLITKEIDKQLLANGARRYDEGHDPVPVLKLFCPWGKATWIISERDPEQPDILFGLSDLGFGCVELGSISLAEIEAVKGPFGLKIERDRHWTGEAPMSAYTEAFQDRGYIGHGDLPKGAAA